MSMRDYALYYQGALLDPECYDSSRLIRFFLDHFEIGISDEISAALDNNQITPELREILCEEFYLDGAGLNTLNEFRDAILASDPDLSEALQVLFSQAGGVSYHHLTGISADFYYSGNKNSVSLDQADILAFSTPLAWESGEERPCCLEEAISWLDRAGQPVFQTDIDWEPRLGELLGTVYG